MGAGDRDRDRGHEGGEARPHAARSGRYKHRLGWYTIAVPPGWTVADESEPVRILADGEDAAAVISVAKIGGAPPRASLQSIVRDVPGVSVIDRREETEGDLRGM